MVPRPAPVQPEQYSEPAATHPKETPQWHL
jgi:hypothetical protein